MREYRKEECIGEQISPPGQEGRRERLSLIASGGVVDKLMPPSVPYCFGA